MKDSTVTAYVRDSCSQSEKVLSLLDNWSISYVKKDISEDKSALKELQEQKIYGAPATFINGQHILGFQKNKLEKALEAAEGGSRFTYLDKYS